MINWGHVYSRVRAFALALAAVALTVASLQPAEAVAPIGSSSLLSQTQTQNLPGIDGANAASNLRWLPNSVVLNDKVYYIASTDATGAELFTSDGTAAGTYVVKESTTGPSSSLYVYYTKLTVSNGKIYYWGSGNEAWVSDGTAAGTTMLKKLSTRMSAQPLQFTKVGTKTFFVAYDSSLYYNDYTATSPGFAGQELWVTDGTSAGTSLVKDIFPGYYTSNGYQYNNNSGVQYITECNGLAYFSANDGTNGPELWVSDGTSAGTNMVKDIYPGGSGSGPTNLACVNNKIVFSANSPTGGVEPWVSDGTSAGTFQLKDIYAGGNSSSPVGTFSSNGKAFFNAYDSTNGNELWATDGTSAGTVLVKNINPGSASSSPSNFVTMGGNTYFSATDSRGTELWVTDGTTVGTLFVADINQTAPGSSSSPKDMYVWNNKLFFSADNGIVGREPWVTDGTNSGTRLIRDMFPGISDMLDQSNSTTNVPFFAGTSAGLFFTANSPIYSQEMWITDGTDAGTRLVVDAKTGPGYSFAKDGIAFNGRIYFAASSAYYGQELWSTDLAGNTQQVIDIYPGAPSGLRTDLAHNAVVYNNRLYFTARNTTNGYELWSTDGTAAGTVQAFDLNPNNSGTNAVNYNGPRYMTVCNGKIYMNWSTYSDYELWVSDGTLAGTSQVKNLNTTIGSEPQQLTCFNNTLYFTADDSYYWQSYSGTVGRELYKTDGTSAGTVLVTDLNASAMTLGYGYSGTNSSSPSYLTVVGNYLYFSATNTSNENELYYTDGTTVTKIDVYSGAASSSPSYLVKYNGLLYFLASTAATGRDMQKLDSATQTVTAVDVIAGASGFTYYQPVVMGGLMWFQSSGEMWTSDGTAANTGQFEDLLPAGNSNPDWLFSLGGVIMYLTYDSTLGSQPRYIVGNAIYTVTYNGNAATGGTPPADLAVMSVSGTVAGNTGNLTRTGYRFVGWNTSPTGVGTSYLPGATITPIVDTPLFAQWATNVTYTITYNANGANGGVAAPAVTGVDQTVVLDNNSGNLTKAGYTFGGWNTLANGTGTTYAGGSRYTATADITLYAKWNALPTFSITFSGNGNTGGSVPTALTGVYSTTTLPGAGTMVKAGFVFAGWNTAADGLGSAFAAGETLLPQTNLTLYAQWTANPTYTLTYNSNGSTSGTAPASATASSTYVVIDNNSGSLAKVGYIFSGWNTAADGTGTDYIGGNNFLLNANTTFYAKWVVANYTVTYSGNGNTGGTAPAAATGVSVSTTVPANTGNLVKAGYNFAGWNTLASGLGTDYAPGSSYSPTASVTLYAKWTALPTYTITYNGNGNTSGGVPVAQSGIYASVNLDANSGALAKSGSYFSGWNTAADGSGTHFDAGSSYTPSANITLYAEWSANPTFTLSYDGNLKTGGVTPVAQTGIASVTTVVGNTGSLVRTGYRFDGWNTLANGTGTTYLAGNSITLTADTTLYALWTSVPTYTLTYSGNGQTTGSVPLAVTTSSGSVVLSANINVLTKSNYNFTGWNTAANGTGTHYDVGATFALSANTTIYAEWTPMAYTITYNANGATSGTAPAATTAAGAQILAGNTGSMAITNYGFLGWNTAADGSGTNYNAGASFTPLANTTLFARWVTYTITFDGNSATSGTAPAAVNRFGAFTLPTNTGSLAKVGYTFAGWNTNTAGTGTTYAAGASYTAAANVTLYALWSALPVYTITYNSNSATSGSVPTSQSGNPGNYNLATNSGNLARTNYIFDGWNTNAAGTGQTYVEGGVFTLSSNVTLYAKWIQLFNITFDGNGATSGSSPIFANAIASTVTLPGNDGTFARTGYVWGGWNTQPDGSGTTYAGGASYTLAANSSLYSLWLPLFTITYDANGAATGTVPTFTPTLGGTVTLATNTGNLARGGYYVTGWNTAANGSGTSYAEGASFVLSGNVTLYAKWVVSVRTITFDGNGSSAGSAPAALVASPGSVTLPSQSALVRDGYNLIGWSDANNGTGTTYGLGGNFTLANDITLYAVWQLKPVYPVGASWISRTIMPLSGGQVTLTGFGFDRLVSVTLGGVPVAVASAAYDRVVLNLPAMPAGAYVLSFIATTSKLDFAQALRYQADKVVAIANYLNTVSMNLGKLQTVDAIVASAGKFGSITLALTTSVGNAKSIRQNAAKLVQVVKLAQRISAVYSAPVNLSLNFNAGAAITGIQLTFSPSNG